MIRANHNPLSLAYPFAIAAICLTLSACAPDDSPAPTPIDPQPIAETIVPIPDPITPPSIYHFAEEMPPTINGDIPQVTLEHVTRDALGPTNPQTWQKNPDGSATWQHDSQPFLIVPGAKFECWLGVASRKKFQPTANYSFILQLIDGTHRREILRHNMTGTTWQRIFADLTPLAGETRRFSFQIQRSAPTKPQMENQNVVPFWGTPIVINATTQATQQRPNLIFISLDTLRADHLGAYGYHRNTSPNIDAFAREAILFKTAIAPSTWTLPTHATVFTGLNPSEHGLIAYGPPRRRFVATSLAELAFHKDYRTAAFTGGGFVAPHWGFAQGFSMYAVIEGPPADPVKYALEYIDNLNGDAFFLFLHTYQIHAPYDAPLPFSEPFFTDPANDLPQTFNPNPKKAVDALTPRERQRVIDLYDGEIAYTDTVIGAFFQELKNRGLYENSIIVLFSDHGEEFWEHDGYGHGISLYDELLHVPLIIKLPGEKPATGTVTGLVALADVYATTAELMNWPHEPRENSISLAPLLKGEPAGTRQRRFVISEVGHREHAWGAVPPNPTKRSYRTATEKIITLNGADPENEWYDIKNDPGETQNLADQFPERTIEIAKLLQQYAEAARSRSQAKEPTSETDTLEDEEDLQEQLEALGYVN